MPSGNEPCKKERQMQVGVPAQQPRIPDGAAQSLEQERSAQVVLVACSVPRLGLRSAGPSFRNIKFNSYVLL
jgi:hypothetical protein